MSEARAGAGLEPTVYSARFTGLRIGEGIRQLRGQRPLRRVGFQRHAESYRSPRTLSAVWGVAGSNERALGVSYRNSGVRGDSDLSGFAEPVDGVLHRFGDVAELQVLALIHI